VRGSFGRGRSNGRHGDNGEHPICQLCGKEGHTVLKCYKRFDASFTGAPENKSASFGVMSYGLDTNWYVNSGATDNITGELEKLTIRDEYSGNDQIHTALGAGMEIKQTGQSIVHSPDRNFLLKNVLYAPEANKNLIFIHHFTSDNNAFWNFTLISFLLRIRQRKEYFFDRKFCFYANGLG
jgi:histone deacetylase 1/2